MTNLHRIKAFAIVGLLPGLLAVPTNGQSTDAAKAVSGKVEIRNAGFEESEIGKKPGDWNLWAREGVKATAETIAEAGQGKRAARIISAGERDWAFTNRIIIPVVSGQFFKISCLARKTGDAPNLVMIQLMSYNGKKMVSFNFADLPFKKLSTEWQSYSMEITVPAGVDGMAIRVIGNGNCDIAIDEISVEKISALTPVPVVETKITAVLPPVTGFATERVVEKFGRGLIAAAVSDGKVYLSWRLLKSDDPKIGFDIFSIVDGREKKLNASPVVQTTDYTVDFPVKGAKYAVSPSAGFQGLSGLTAVRPLQNDGLLTSVNYTLSNPKASVDKIGVGDLDGDGEYDFVARYSIGGSNVDPWHVFWKPSVSPFTLEAVKSDGTILWSKNLGWNIECGIWYSPYIVCDVNGDGKAEVIVKAFDPNAGDLREKEGKDKGKVMTGEEYLMVLDGMTGNEIARAPWPSRKNFEGMEMAYNFYSRNQLAIAYLDGKTPCIIALRGTYGLMLADAWQLNNGNLESLWKYDSRKYDREYTGQGAHTTRTIDLDGDGRDEIILGGAVLDDNGQPLWSTGHGHPDYVYVTNITNKNPGLEVVTIYETHCKNGGGVTCADAKTGKVVWQFNSPTGHLHLGYAGDIDPLYRGWMVGATEISNDDKKAAVNDRRWHFSPEGELLLAGSKVPFDRKAFLYWDADLQREICNAGISDFGGGPSGGGYEGHVLMQADVLGDWREEVLTARRGGFRVFSTIIPAMDRRVCLMQDNDYRQTVISNSMGYMYEPALSYLPTDLSPNLNLTCKNNNGTLSLQVVTSSPLDRPLKGKLKLIAPAGISLVPAEWTVDLKPGILAVTEVKFGNNSPSFALIKAELQMDDGVILRGQVPTGVKPVKQPTINGIITEAEDFIDQKNGNVQVRTDKTGIHKKCFSHWDKAGHEITWSMKVPKDGKYLISVRYCASGDASREITVNGKDIGAFEFPSSGGFGDGAEDWQSYTLNRNHADQVFDFKKGNVELKMKNVDNTSLNLDLIQLIPVK